MRQAVLNVDHGTLAKFGFDVFQDAGLLDIEVLSCEGSRGVSRLHVEERPDEQRLDDLETIQWWERISNEGSKHIYLVEMDVATQLEQIGIDADRMTRTEWAEVHNEGFSFEHTGSQEKLSAMMTNMKTAGFGLTLEKLGDYRIPETSLDALTDRQQEVLEVAYELGYYDVPKESSTTEIAAEFGVDDSTISEHLQRAEHNLLKTLLD